MKKELLEIKRTLTIDRYNITRITGYIVDNDRNCRLEFVKNFLNLEETETFKYLDILKKVLSGKPGRNMFQLDFKEKTRKQHLNTIVKTGLEDNDVRQIFLEEIAESIGILNKEYSLILIASGIYDIPGIATDGANLDESEEVYEYMIGCICPVSLSAAGLSYKPELADIQERTMVNAGSSSEAYNAAVELFGAKAGPALAEFCQSGKLNFDELGASLNDNLGSVNDTFEATLDPADQFKLTLNQLKDAGFDVGNALGPVLAECLQMVTPILKDIIASWNSLSPGTQEMILKCLLLAAALGPVFSIISKVSGGISGVIDVGTKVAPVIAKAKTGFAAFNAVLAANPIIIVIAAVVALIAIFVTLYNKCEWFRDGVNAVFGGIRDFIKGVVDKIKGFMSFEWKLPKIKLPHFKASGSWSLVPPKFPKFSVDWYANGGILNSPTIFGMNGDRMMGGGEAGAEAVLPIDLLKTYIRDEMQSNNTVLAQLIAEALSELTFVIENNISLGDKKLADVLVDAIIKKLSSSVKWKKGAVGV